MSGMWSDLKKKTMSPERITKAESAARMVSLEMDINAALTVIERFGGIDGAHHKQWVIDQVVRALTGKGYKAWVKASKNGEDGPDTYDWDEGTPP